MERIVDMSRGEVIGYINDFYINDLKEMVSYTIGLRIRLDKTNEIIEDKTILNPKSYNIGDQIIYIKKFIDGDNPHYITEVVSTKDIDSNFHM